MQVGSVPESGVMTGFVPSGNTKLFPVVGDPIAQVRSPGAITRILAGRSLDAAVVPMHVEAAGLGELMNALLLVRNIGGVLVTVPHKPAALAFCERATKRAVFARSVNVVRRTASGWQGDNTDGQGCLDGIRHAGFDVSGKTAMLVGCGGAGAAIAMEILERGATLLAVHDIDLGRRDGFIARLVERFPGRVTAGSHDPSGYDLVINATPAGMSSGDPLPIDVSKLQPRQFVACVITKPDATPLIAEARRIGCRTMSGDGMFDAQAETLAGFLLEERHDALLHEKDVSFVS
ncbi:shikimate dehydrogenase family protein [Mesorhizobium sp. 1B3]|uniref:shikimate dehydrogenase family protein n=1 Tax=Mesorhizobium sp. 1B3 TaxID=3243599 RepID=UPI003D95AF17